MFKPNGTAALPSRTGAEFTANVDVESDGSLTLLSESGHGSLSAHRDYAQKHFGEALWCMNRLSWINDSGVRVVLTRWNTQKYRHSPIGAR